MATVYVAQEPKPGPSGFTYDISPCLGYGQPVYVFTAKEQPGLATAPAVQKAKRVLKDFSDDDFLLWCGGDPSAWAITAIVAAKINHGKVKVLRWERERVDGVRTKRGFYIPTQIEL